jgi:membrane protease YdiL (CAAX protease family)
MDTRVYMNDKTVSGNNISRSHASYQEAAGVTAIVRWVLAAALFVLFTILIVVYSDLSLYLYLGLYTAMIAVFHREFSFSALVQNMKSGFRFWILAGATCLILYLINSFNMSLTVQFGVEATGIYPLTYDSDYMGFFLFAIVLIFLQPVAENMVLRKAMLDTDSRAIRAAVFVASLFFAGLLHARGSVGILESVLFALPMVIVYIRTRNIYIPMLAQFVFGCINYIPTIVYDLMRDAMA